MYSFTYIRVLKLLTGSTVRDVSCRTYRRFHATLTGIQAVSSQSCCAGRSREQVTSLAVHAWQLAPPTASSSVLLTTSQRQTMSTRSSSVKRCLCHQAWITCQNLPGPPSAFLCGVKGHTWNYCAEEGEPGTRLVSSSFTAVPRRTHVPKLSLLRAIIPRMTFDPAEKSGGRAW